MLTPKLTKGEVSPHDVSTDSGDDSPSNGDSSGSSDNEMCESFCSDHVAATETSSVDEFADVLVYPLTIMLQLRAAVGRRFAPPLRYGTQPREGPKVLNSSKASVANDVPAWRQRAQKTTDAQKKSKLPAASSNSWLAQQARSKDQHDEDEKVERACRSILNKLTVEKFDSLYEQLGSSCGIRSPNHLALLMREIFEKATVQHHFIPMYADLCVRLEKDPRLASAMGPEGGPSSFRHLLLNQCQSSFEDLLESRARNSSTASDEDSESQEQLEGLCKRRALGNIRLVGQLMVRGMLHSKLLVECCGELLNGQKECPEALESLAVLLTVTGPKFDTPKFKFQDRFSAIFDRVELLSKDKGIPARVRFLLRDVMDLRAAGWPSRARPASGEPKGPMTLEEVKEQQDLDEAEARQKPQSSTRGGGSRDKGKSTGKAPAATTPSKQPPQQQPARSTAAVSRLLNIVGTKDGSSKQEKDAPTKKEKEVNIKKEKETCAKKEKEAHAKKANEASAKKDKDGAAPKEKEVAKAKAPKTPEKAPKSNEASSKKKEQSEPESEPKPSKKKAEKKATPPPSPVAAVEKAENAPVVPPMPVKMPVADEKVEVPIANVPFNVGTFHRDLSAVLRDLRTDGNVPAAVRRVRSHGVPAARQAAEFVDIVTRAAEEPCGSARRSSFAFVTGLAAGEPSAFLRAECLKGVKIFFQEVYEELCGEVPRLPAIVSSELIPTLRNVYSAAELDPLVPQMM
eukprot:gnl/TRDRNA2_/TRDRNA2_131522_c0_seq2.p1 gnl/TRDRNA2_/TRDRNA2_131522_c0~~gnl/TRDRNA2_/TRDRNA2_131522_c0_seq2.p1  ORF type:complete len:859 (-),score=244.41 gnl/TRDRNA2_/TRDRNA2_131522_c0_seq2:168-2390(-)